jgi:hypothetical protein
MPIPFPVSPEYRIRATVRPLARSVRPDGDRERGLFDTGGDYSSYVGAKLAALADDTPCRQVAGALSQSDGRSLRHLCDAIQREAPTRLAIHDGALHLPELGLDLDVDFGAVSAGDVRSKVPLGGEVATHLQRQSPRDRLLDAIGLAIQEDYVLLRGRTDTTSDCAKLLHVCLPSGWSARDKVGLDFGAIHQPVPHNSPLLSAHHGLVRALIERAPFVRYVWGLHRDDTLCHDPYVHRQPPEARHPTPDAAAAATWFRVERQTTLGVPEENAAFFFIRVYQVPLTRAITTPDRARLMSAALADMTPDLAKYKGVTHRREALIHWLNERSERH